MRHVDMSNICEANRLGQDRETQFELNYIIIQICICKGYLSYLHNTLSHPATPAYNLYIHLFMTAMAEN